MEIIPFGHLSIFINPFGLDIMQITRRNVRIYGAYASLSQQGAVIKCLNAQGNVLSAYTAHTLEWDFYSVRH